MGRMSVDTAAVNRLLAASREAHDMKRRNAGRIDGTGKVAAQPNWPRAEQYIAEALRLRLDAHDADPEHTASGWGDDTAPDAMLIRFYVAYSKPLISESDMAKVIARFPEYAEVAYIP